jgi:phosphoribosylformylglycinamidine (FGAM) synthase PurS component
LKIIIDRFEDNFAIVELENKTMVNMPKKLVPENAVEGDVLEIRINHQETKNRKEKIKKMCEDLWE